MRWITGLALLASSIVITQELYSAPDKSFQNNVPLITVIIVIDQFAYHELQKLLPHFKGGIQFLHNNGIRYVTAFQPQGSPETGPGHAAIATGAYPKDHGFAANMWPTREGVIACDDDNRPESKVFGPDGVVLTGKSAQHLMVDTLSDQLIINSRPTNSFMVYSLALKSRSAIAMAGRLGKALWFDEQTGWFTSSKAYMDQLPSWLSAFNKDHSIQKDTAFQWHLRYDARNKAYNFPFINDYTHTKVIPMANQTIPIDRTKKTPYDAYAKTPNAAHELFGVARHVVENYLKNHSANNLVLWLGMSNLDTVGHLFGPNSLENIDTLYHLDRDIQEFMSFLEEKIDRKNILWVLTADHGVMPIVEQMQSLGFDLARRLVEKNIIPAINTALEAQWGIPSIITYTRFPNVYINHQAIAHLDESTRAQLIRDIKKQFLSYRGVKKVWTEDELLMAPLTTADTIALMLKNQIYQGRTGDILVQTDPYVFASEYPEGTNHSYAYAYNTHVPLMLYRQGMLHNKIITKKVELTQLAPTLAYLLDVSRPSASASELLPVR